MPMIRPARVLEEADEAVDDAGDDDLQRLRQDDQPHHLPVAEAERRRRLVLARAGSPAGRRARPPPCRRPRTASTPTSARSSLSKLTPGGRNSGSMTLAMNSTVISGTPRHELDEGDAEAADDRQLRAPAEREQDAERQRRGDADDGDDQRHMSPPQSGGLDRRAGRACRRQQDEGDDREDDEQKSTVSPLVRHLRDHHRHEAGERTARQRG